MSTMPRKIPLSTTRWGSQWHPIKNLVAATEVGTNATGTAWWVSEPCGHEWEARITVRLKSSTHCWVCSGKRILPVFNDLLSLVPEIGAQWHPTLNGSLRPQDVGPGSSKKVHWLSSACGHTWRATISSRTNKRYGCAVCAGRQVLTGFNDLATCSPDAAKEWHPHKNGARRPETTLNGTHQKAWWKCSRHHEWEATVVARTRPGTSTGKPAGCPYCSGRLAIPGENDLATTHPSLARRWHPTKNSALLPAHVKAGSQKRVWWLGKCAHEWKAKIAHRANEDAGCPYCSGNKVLAGFNDIATTHPDIAEEWHPTKNTSQPTEVTRGHRSKVWWLCPVDHEYRATPNTRTNPSTESGCPDCYAMAVSDGTSDVERAIAEALTVTFPDAIHGARVDRRLTGRRSWALDVYVPSLRLVVEFDGQSWHCSCCSPFAVPEGSLEARDRAKTTDLLDMGYRVIRVRTPHLGRITDDDLILDRNPRPQVAADAVMEHLSALGIVPEPAVA